MPATLNQYTLGRELGSGVSCKVKLAKDESGTRYAIKILKQDSEFDELVKTAPLVSNCCMQITTR